MIFSFTIKVSMQHIYKYTSMAEAYKLNIYVKVQVSYLPIKVFHYKYISNFFTQVGVLSTCSKVAEQLSCSSDLLIKNKVF